MSFGFTRWTGHDPDRLLRSRVQRVRERIVRVVFVFNDLNGAERLNVLNGLNGPQYSLAIERLERFERSFRPVGSRLPENACHKPAKSSKLLPILTDSATTLGLERRSTAPRVSISYFD